MPRILIVENSATYAEILTEVLAGIGHETKVVEDAESALSAYSESAFDLCMIEAELQGMESLELLARLKSRDPASVAILVGEAPGSQMVIGAFKGGANDFLIKPVDLRLLRTAIEDGLEVRQSARRVRPKGTRAPMLTRPPIPITGIDGGHRRVPAPVALKQLLIGASDRMTQLRASIEANLGKLHPLVVRGERGSGKRVIAEFIHEYSYLDEAPLVVVDAARATEEKLLADLGGSGPESAAGRADGGTLLLENAHRLPAAVQDAWSGALQGRTDQGFRIICTTATDLDELSSQERFSDDLLMAIGIVPALVIPPLRENKEDFDLVLRHYVRESDSPYFESAQIRFTRGARERMRDYPWPGNYSELVELVTGLVGTCRDPIIDESDLPYYFRALEDWPSLDDILGREEERYIRSALAVTGGDKGRVGELPGVTAERLERWAD